MPADDLGVYFLDVGQGDATFIVPPAGEGDPILFDCADVYVAERFVAEHGVHNLRAVIASHLDVDHIRGMLAFLESHFAAGRHVERLLLGLDRQPDGEQALVQLIERATEWERQPPHAGFVLEAPLRNAGGPLEIARGSGWRVDVVLPFYGTILGAAAAGHQDTNLRSAVLRIERQGSAILVGGDAPLRSFMRLEPPLLGARVLRASHHGGDDAGSQLWPDHAEFYDHVAAETVAISVGSNNGYGHPTAAHVRAARRQGQCRVVCTQVTPRCHDDLGALRAKALEMAATVEWPHRHRTKPGSPARPRRADETPCAGTIVVRMASDGAVSVEPAAGGWHQTDMIDRMKTPMCQATP